MWNPPVIRALEAGKKYRAQFFNPSDGKLHPAGEAMPDEAGNWKSPNPPAFRDWMLVLEA